MIVCSRLSTDGLETSPTKSVVTRTTRKIGEAVAARLSAFKTKYASNVKGLGVAMAAKTQQHSGVLQDRLRAFRQRIRRLQRLRTWSLKTDRVLRTGGLASIIDGE